MILLNRKQERKILDKKLSDFINENDLFTISEVALSLEISKNFASKLIRKSLEHNNIHGFKHNSCVNGVALVFYKNELNEKTIQSIFKKYPKIDKNKRKIPINVCLSQENYNYIKDLAKLQNISMSCFINNFIMVSRKNKLNANRKREKAIKNTK